MRCNQVILAELIERLCAFNPTRRGDKTKLRQLLECYITDTCFLHDPIAQEVVKELELEKLEITDVKFKM